MEGGPCARIAPLVLEKLSRLSRGSVCAYPGQASDQKSIELLCFYVTCFPGPLSIGPMAPTFLFKKCSLYPLISDFMVPLFNIFLILLPPGICCLLLYFSVPKGGSPLMSSTPRGTSSMPFFHVFCRCRFSTKINSEIFKN